MSLHAPNGSINLDLNTEGEGLYSPLGHLRGTITTQFPGIYHTDGSLRVVVNDTNENGYYHSSGSIRVSTEAGNGIYSSTGAMRVTLNTQPTPTPPGPADILTNTLNGTTIPFTSTTGIVIVRIAGITTANNTGNISVTWDGDPMLQAFKVIKEASGPFVAFYYINPGNIGSGDVVITASANFVYSAVRVGEVAVLTSVGTPVEWYEYNYYAESNVEGRTANSGVAQIVCCLTDTGYEFTADPDIDIQWQTLITDHMSAGFSVSFRPSNLDDYFVWYPRLAQKVLLVGVEMVGLELV